MTRAGAMNPNINTVLVTIFQLLIITTLTVVVNAIPMTILFNSSEKQSPAFKNDEVEKVEIWSEKFESTDSPESFPPVDHTLAIVTPIAAGIVLMVLVFFIYLASENNANEHFDYETLSASTEIEDGLERDPRAPSTSAAYEVENRVEPNPT